MATVIKTTFKLRRGKESQWEEKNPILALGEPGYASDINSLKIGDGVTPWNELQYIAGSKFQAQVSPDGKSLAVNTVNELAVYGFEGAEINQVPMKNELGELIWISLAPVATSGLFEDLNQKETVHFYGGSAFDCLEVQEETIDEGGGV